MLRWRLMAALFIVVPLLGFFFLDAAWNYGLPGVWLVPLGLTVTVLATAEMSGLVRQTGLRPSAWVVQGASIAVFLAGILGGIWGFQQDPSRAVAVGLSCTLAASAGALVLSFLAEMWRFKAPGAAMTQVAMTFFVVSYGSMLLSLVAQLRFVHSSAWGMVALISMLFVVKMSDTGAYVVGKLLGRNRMSPVLSPGKTFEGAVGGVIVAAVSAWVFFLVVPSVLRLDGTSRAPWWGCWVYGLGIGLAGMVGDLSESLLKRDACRKDSSQLFPGLGGILDVIDSVLMAGPVALLCWGLGLVGPSS